MSYKPKLIEVALPLAAINEASAREKSIRHGHPSTLHLWWARRPLAAARAVIWASLVDDPSSDASLTPEQQYAKREELFKILEQLVVWENSNNPDVLAKAKAEIDRCFPGGPPPILDPFGGGGAIPLEAQRLGLTALSGDLNPVAVLIQKAMLEIPPRFAGKPPVHPSLQQQAPMSSWTRAQGLAADIEAYGQWVRGEAHRRIGHLYRDAIDHNGESLTPIAWIWARTVESPDPTWRGHVPLVSSWTLSKPKAGKPAVWIEPVINRVAQTITYAVRHGGEPTFARTVERGNAVCVATGAAIKLSQVDEHAARGELGFHLLAIVAEGTGARRYVSPTAEDVVSAQVSASALEPNLLRQKTRGTFGGNAQGRYYGMLEFRDYYTPRQLVALTAFSDLIAAVREQARTHAAAAGLEADKPLHLGGKGSEAYADAIATYLAFAVDRCADYWSKCATWAADGFIRNTFARQAIPMAWDFAECNPFSTSTGNWTGAVAWVRKALDELPATRAGSIQQRDARARVDESVGAVISTDPPYYDNIAYADLSDYFYVWLRRNLHDVWPDECATLLTPKTDELIANQYRAGSRAKAEEHFESGMSEFMSKVASSQSPDAPATIYYAYKATESNDGEIRSTGWDTFLQAVLDAGMQVTATWPMRTEKPGRMVAVDSNALASSIVLACRRRETTAPLASRGEFVAALRGELPEAVRRLQSGNITPVDIPQSTIGPGIAIFSRFSKVVESDGSTMSVSAALTIINDVLGEILDGEESEMDADSRFALAWYSQYGYNPGLSGDADSVARAKNTSVAGVTSSGIGETRRGKFRLYERAELSDNWSPTRDTRLTVWEVTQQLIAALDRSEAEAGALLQQLGGYGERARTLSYLLFKKATEKGSAAEAGAYNGLITAWPTLRSAPGNSTGPTQTSLLD